MSKKIAIIALLVIAIIAVAGAATYIVQQKKEAQQRQEGAEKVRQEEQVATIPETPKQTLASQPEEPATTEPVDTSDWKVYRNEKYGFEVRYPPELVAEVVESLSLNPSFGWEGVAFRLPTQDPSYSGTPYTFFATRFTLPGKPVQCEGLPAEMVGKQTEEKIGGVTFIRSEIRSPNEYFFQEGDLVTEILSYEGEYKGVCYYFSYYVQRDEQETWSSFLSRSRGEIDTNIIRFDRIVSTFKLLETK